MSGLDFFGYNSKNIDSTYQNVGFLFKFRANSKRLKVGVGHLGVKIIIL